MVNKTGSSYSMGLDYCENLQKIKWKIGKWKKNPNPHWAWFDKQKWNDIQNGHLKTFFK